jgi:dTDP-4-dehydrorhamnose reductase
MVSDQSTVVEKTKILITGSKGMLGSALVNVLLSKFEVKGIDIEDCDIINKENTRRIIKNYKPHIVIHTAAYTDVDGCELGPDKAFAINTRGTENVVCAVKEVDAAFLYMSTDYIFDGRKDKPYTETDIPNAINTYGKSKLEGERITQSLLKTYIILRTSWLFGPNGKNFVTTILKKAEENKELKVVNDQFGSPTYTLDLADAIKTLLSARYSLLATNYGTYHITNSGHCSWYEFAKEIVSLKQLNTQILPINSTECKRPARRPKMSILDNSKFINSFKLTLRPWQDALKHFLQKYT